MIGLLLISHIWIKIFIKGELSKPSKMYFEYNELIWSSAGILTIIYIDLFILIRGNANKDS